MTGAPTHRMTNTPLHKIWKGIRVRCKIKTDPAYKYYGGRGITLCPEWEFFINFYNDMSKTYYKGLTIDRINNDGPYNKKNCRWVTRKEQSQNRRPSTHWQFKDSGISTNNSGVRGVSFDKSRNRWIAMICVNKKQINLGRFDTIEEAARAYKKASKELRNCREYP